MTIDGDPHDASDSSAEREVSREKTTPRDSRLLDLHRASFNHFRGEAITLSDLDVGDESIPAVRYSPYGFGNRDPVERWGYAITTARRDDGGVLLKAQSFEVIGEAWSSNPDMRVREIDQETKARTPVNSDSDDYKRVEALLDALVESSECEDILAAARNIRERKLSARLARFLGRRRNQ